MKKVELIHPPHYDCTDDSLDPPLGLLYIATHIQSTFQEDEVSVIVNNLSGKKEVDWNIGNANIYGITVYAPSHKTVESIIKKCKEINPNAIIVVGGAHASAVPNMFKGIVDHVIVGKGELAMVDIIKGEATSFIVSNHKVFNCFTMPKYELVEINSYHRTIAGRKSIPMLTTRGCPYHCSFCGLSYLHSMESISFADPEIVVNQIKTIKNKFGITAIGFQDDIFTLKKERFKKLMTLLKPLNIKFRCHGRAGIDTEETYELLAEAGCAQVAWGIESGSQHMLDRMNKKSKVQDNYNVIQWAKKYGIDSRSFFVIGFPGETKETLEETKQFIEWSNPDQYFVSSFVPYPGTDVWNNPKKYGVIYIDKNFEQFYQIDKKGYGGLTVDTEWLTRKQFSDLEKDFREWILKNKPLKGMLLDYEKKLTIALPL
ncbi:MAG: radical SAM protein [Flavobacterium sp.]|nr:radical SAM protein [Flavobacterium sp.]